MSDQDFIELVCDAYRELRGLPSEAEIEYKIGLYPRTGTLQIILKEKK